LGCAAVGLEVGKEVCDALDADAGVWLMMIGGPDGGAGGTGVGDVASVTEGVLRLGR
jgi:hypothetical protein